MRHILLFSSSLLAATLIPAAARAGEAPEAAEAQPTDDIIVTGEKFHRSLQETTASVGVTTSRRIEEEAIQTLQDVFERTVNVSETYGNSGFTIRGISNRGVSGGGDAATATVFVDGAPLIQEAIGNGPTDMWDVAQVEIFRGPQSTLQGLNALAGAVHIRTNDPTDEWSLRGRAILASRDTRNFAIAGGGPIVPGELAFRVAAEKRKSDGDVFNPTRDAPENPVDSTSVRAKLLWTPSALEGFEARASYQHFKGKSGYMFTYANLDVEDYFNNRENHSDAPNTSDTNSDQAILDLRLDLGSGFTLSSLTTYIDIDSLRSYDGDNTAEPIAYGTNWADVRTLTQELRLNYHGERLSGLVGLFYYNRRQDSGSESRSMVPTPETTISGLLQQNGLDAATAAYIASLYVAALPQVPVDYFSDYSSKVETFALFADGRYELTDRLSLLAGFRIDRETNRVALDQGAVFAGVYPNPADYGDLAPAIYAINQGVQMLVDQAAGAAPPTSRTFTAFLPKIGLNMAWTPDLSTAFLVQRGYRSGGSSVNTARSQAFPYDPEYTWNYELSLRSVWLDGALTVNGNAYYIDWKDQQSTVNFGLNLYDYHTANAGRSHLYGFELEAAHRVSQAFDWYAGIAHNRTKFDEFTTDVGIVTDFSGMEFPYAPHWTLSAGANVRFGSGFSANLNANHRSSVFTDLGHPQSDSHVGARTLVNARLGYRAANWGVSVFATNLFDTEYMQYYNRTYNSAILGQPRTLGVVLEAGF
ncbi:TonB-dependent receptor [Sandaracinobacter sp. RS1-74]|uniref:TonB-dependent receptor n=1 Tax=Sandaracinobacteroides sayramensis TaxID=2913411 RepID=UPI001ED9F011|nr:TonB-dependent receptor [Sandaracinobacteroides sayramensis]MCG2841778.1 TonB-dependent receptor [Sandaracinobacteroides sayramensis]